MVTDRIARFLSWLIAIGLVFYIILRAGLVAFTHDESITVLDFGTRSLSYISNVTYTNNHLLNTWWVHFCLSLYLKGEFIFRFPNVVCGILFVVFARKLSAKLFTEEWKKLLFLIGVCFHPFLTDFFSLCRGYGISCGMLLLSVWYVYRYYAADGKIKFACFAVIAMIVGTLANYTLLIPLLLLIAWFKFDLLFLRAERRKIIPFLIFLLPVVIFLYWFLRMMFRLRASGNFDFGGQEGFWSNTVPSLVENDHFKIYEIWNPLKTVLVYLYAFLFVIAFLLTGSVTAMVLQHYLLGTFYPEHRAAIYLIPLFSLFVFGIKLNDQVRKIFSSVLVVFYVVVVVLGFTLSLNLSKTIMWPLTQNFQKLFWQIQRDPQFSFNSHVSAGFELLHSYNYYNWNARAKTAYIDQSVPDYEPFCDYAILWKYQQDPPADYYDLIGHTEEANLFRLKKNRISFDTVCVRTDVDQYSSIPDIKIEDTLLAGSRVEIWADLCNTDILPSTMFTLQVSGSKFEFRSVKVFPRFTGDGECRAFASFILAQDHYPGDEFVPMLTGNRVRSTYNPGISFRILKLQKQ